MIFNRNFKTDRRRRQRQILNTSVRISTVGGPVDALGVNISESGMCLFTVANLQVGLPVQIEYAPSESTAPVRVSAVVRYRALYLYGIEFLPDSEQVSGIGSDQDNAVQA